MLPAAMVGGGVVVGFGVGEVIGGVDGGVVVGGVGVGVPGHAVNTRASASSETKTMSTFLINISRIPPISLVKDTYLLWGNLYITIIKSKLNTLQIYAI
jgi:uncharacterized membrane protein